MSKARAFTLFAALLAIANPLFADSGKAKRADLELLAATRSIEAGRQTFRHDTFGSEAFWGGQLRLHEAVLTLSPRQLLALGIKVDAGALPKRLVGKLKRGEVDLDDPASTALLLQLDAAVGVKAFFDAEGRAESIGIQCALCHSTVDDSLAPGIGRRRDGWANRDLDVGKIVAAAPDLRPFAQLLGVDEATVRTVLFELGSRKVRRRARARRQSVPPGRQERRDADPARIRHGRRQPPYLDGLGLGHALECVRRESRDARQGHVLRSAPRGCDEVPDRRS